MGRETVVKAVLGGALAFLLAIALVSSSSVFRAHKERNLPASPSPQWRYSDFEKVDEDEENAVYRIGREELKP